MVPYGSLGPGTSSESEGPFLPPNKEHSPSSVSLQPLSIVPLDALLLCSHWIVVSLGLWHIREARSGMPVQRPHSILQLHKFWGTLTLLHAQTIVLCHWVGVLLYPRKHQGQGKLFQPSYLNNLLLHPS